MSAFSLAWRNLVRQKRRTVLMGAVVGFGFAAFALAGGFIAQSFEALKEGTIRTVGQLQAVDRRAVTQSEEKTLEYGLHDAARARAIASADPAVSAVLPRIDFVGLATSGARSISPGRGGILSPRPRRPSRGSSSPPASTSPETGTASSSARVWLRRFKSSRETR